jgi:carboxymethylenebutenolidase
MIKDNNIRYEVSMSAEMISFPSGSRTLAGYFAQPEGAGPSPALAAGASVPAVLVIHEIFGLNENMKDIARRFAGEGYAALAVDLFAGANRIVCMFSLFMGMRSDSTGHGGIRDLRAALDFLGQQPGVDPARLGAVGYCLGGGLAIALACADNRLKAIAPYYGMNPHPLEAVERSCPVVGSYPAKDFTAKAGRALEASLERFQIPHDIKIYEGAGHSFFNDTLPAYNADAALDSWERVKTFFTDYV